jgi:hypothetical protein
VASHNAFFPRGFDLAGRVAGFGKDLIGVLGDQPRGAIDAAAAAFGEPKPGPDQGRRAVSKAREGLFHRGAIIAEVKASFWDGL